MKRLGVNGIHELYSHPWLRDFPWNLLKTRALPSEFDPVNKSKLQVKGNFEWDDENDEQLKFSRELLRRDSVQDLF